ncbi:MAG TPA: hypothetical protein VMX94_00445 [Armatimonadota bacterium]|nr:hypothetical protein [Armatimonadota bacterium]
MRPILTGTRICRVLAVTCLLVFQCAQALNADDVLQKESLALFPFAIGSDVGASKQELIQQCAGDLLLLVNEGLAGTRRYSVVLFDPRAASVDRAVREKQITEKEIAQPIDTGVQGVAKARKLATLMGANLAMIGSIDRYDFNERKAEAELTVTLQLIDARSGSFSTITATGRAAAVEGKTGQGEEALGIGATYEVAEKLLAEVTAASLTQPTSPAVPQPSHSKKNRGLIAAMIGAIIVGFVIGSG